MAPASKRARADLKYEGIAPATLVTEVQQQVNALRDDVNTRTMPESTASTRPGPGTSSRKPSTATSAPGELIARAHIHLRAPKDSVVIITKLVDALNTNTTLMQQQQSEIKKLQATHSAKMQELRKQNTSLETRYMTLKKESSGLEDQRKNLEDELSTATHKAERLTNEKNKLEDTNKILQGDNGKFQQLLDFARQLNAGRKTK
jgi:DNA repair exonuclease SbcCD ATPase subunit